MADARIVVGAGGSSDSLIAVRWAAVEARLRETELRVVVAHHGPPPPGVMHEAVTEARKAAPGVDVRGIELPGYAVPALLHAAETASLLVVGDRAGGVLPGRPAGSVAAQVATRARCSVVVVRGGVPADGPVVVGVDDDPAADAVMARAFEEAALHRTSLVAVTAGGDGGAGAGDGLDAWRERYRSVAAQREYVPGRPDRVMVDRCRSARLAVVGPRRHGYQGVLLGAIGTRLLRRADCPVLIAR
jgi:nucleotide-binding universal stress UspA family protein